MRGETVAAEQESVKPDQAKTVQAALATLYDIFLGSTNKKDGSASRLESDPLGVLLDMEDVFSAANRLIRKDVTQPADWRKALKVKLETWTDIVHLIDEPIPYVIWPIAVRGSMTQIQGLPKGGKSAFSLYLSVCATTGIWPYPQYIRADTPLKVLYIAWEDPRIMMSKRLSIYSKGLDLARTFSSPNLQFLFGPDLFVDQEAGEYNLREAIRELKPDIVFIDTLSHIHQADENAASEMKVPMKNLDRIAKEENISLVYLHHTKKGGDGAAQEKGRGSGAIAAAWHVLVDWGQREEGSNVNPIEVQSKFESEWIKWAITYNTQKDEFGNLEAVKWDITSAEYTASAPTPTSHALKFSKIIETARRLAISNPPDGWVTAQQIANASNLGLETKAIKRHLQQLCQDGFMEFKEGVNSKVPNMYRPIDRTRGNLET